MIFQSSDLEFSYSRGPKFIYPDITLKRGECALLLGPSGSGKSTLLHTLAGLQEPNGGEVRLNETNLFQLPAAQRDKFRGENICIIFQKSHFLPYLNIFENLSLGKNSSQSEKYAVLENLQISHLAKKLPAECSIGELQRASIARAVLQKPKLILADEPTSALDDANAERVGNLLKASAEKHQACLLVVTHDARLKPLFTKTYAL